MFFSSKKDIANQLSYASFVGFYKWKDQISRKLGLSEFLLATIKAKKSKKNSIYNCKSESEISKESEEEADRRQQARGKMRRARVALVAAAL